jgi:hypothetical protein
MGSKHETARATAGSNTSCVNSDTLSSVFVYRVRISIQSGSVACPLTSDVVALVDDEALEAEFLGSTLGEDTP